MAILQRFFARRDAEAAAGRLLRAPGAAVSREELRSAIDDGERAREDCPDHFGLTFALGIAAEVMAGRLPWGERADWLERAARAYETAIDLADAGKLAGAGQLPDVAPEAWEPGLSLE